MADAGNGHRPTVPPPGPTLDFRAWARAVHRRVSAYIEDLHVTPSENEIVWAHFSKSARLRREERCWYFRLEEDGQQKMLLCIDRFDLFTAQNTADTVLGHFDPALSTPNKPPPPVKKKPA